MIKITYDKDNVHITGHGIPDVCASVSATAYTIANAIVNLQISGIDSGQCSIEDNLEDDYMHFKIEKHSEITDILIETMINCFKDIVEDGEGYVTIKES